MKRLAEALADGDQIYAVIKGSALNNDGAQKVSFTAPSVDGHAEVIALAQALAGFPPETISYIEAHGTGTPIGDIAELGALNRIFGARSKAMRVMSPKGNFGHPHGPAGAVGLLAGLFSMQQSALMPTAGTHDEAELMPEVNKLHAVINTPAEGRIDTLQVNAFGFGGQNASLVVSRE